MKAQISLEFLLLFTISIAVLAITFSSFEKLYSASNFASNRAFFIRESAFLLSIIKELCITGDGNSRVISLPYELNVSYSSQQIIISSPSGNLNSEVRCEVEESTLVGEVKVYNEEGKIFFD